MEAKLNLSVKFPELHKLLPKGSNLNVNNLNSYIWVKNNYAIVFNNHSVLVLDLKRYFLDKKGIPENEENVAFEILDYLSGKYLSADYWEELTKGNALAVVKGIENDYIRSDSGTTIKNLTYKDIIVDYELEVSKDIIKLLKDRFTQKTKSMNVSSLPMDFFNNLKTALNSLIKDDDINFNFCGIDKAVQFSFHQNSYIFGIVINDYDNCEEMFNFDEMFEFAKILE